MNNRCAGSAGFSAPQSSRPNCRLWWSISSETLKGIGANSVEIKTAICIGVLKGRQATLGGRQAKE
ncbi:MAG TPA: hypothetical protein VGG72_00260 [Bryobacteraceae bacterium]|jgi:hypothetical protein